MQTAIEFYFDFGSPNAYLAHKRLQQFHCRYGLKIEYQPMLLGGVFKLCGNLSPAALPVKNAYWVNHDLPRFKQRYGVEFNFNPHFPINTLALMRGVIAADKLAVFMPYINAVYDAMWVAALNLGESAVVAKVLSEAGLPATELLSLAQTPQIKAELVAKTEAAAARGIFGAPTMFLGEEMFFGQDRLDFVEEALIASL